MYIYIRSINNSHYPLKVLYVISLIIHLIKGLDSYMGDLKLKSRHDEIY